MSLLSKTFKLASLSRTSRKLIHTMSPVTSPRKAAAPASPPPPVAKPIIKKPFLVISVDGNISSGKSTLVSTLADLFPKDFNYAVETVPEPLEKWTNLKGFNMLDLLYKDTVKNNFMFQHYVQLTRLVDTVKPCLQDENEEFLGKIRVMERSIQNNRYCFSELARRQGTLHEAEFTVIAEWYKWLEEHSELPLDLIIYLRTTPEIVFERMQSRGRSEESTVPLQYLTELHETYEDWLIRGKIEEEDSTLPRKYKVIVVDANKNKTEVAEECRKQITEFLENYKKTESSDAKNDFEASPAKRRDL